MTLGALNKPTALGTPVRLATFGAPTTQPQNFGLFGNQNQADKPALGFGATTTQPQSVGLFGNQNQAAKPALGFGTTTTQHQAIGLYGNQPATSTGFGFGATTNTFGTATAEQKPAAFGGNTATPEFGMPAGAAFGATSTPFGTSISSTTTTGSTAIPTQSKYSIVLGILGGKLSKNYVKLL